MIKLMKIQYLGDFKFELLFSDGSQGQFDLKSYTAHRSGPFLEALRQEDYARRAFIEAGALCWPNGLELSAGRLHELVSLELVV